MKIINSILSLLRNQNNKNVVEKKEQAEEHYKNNRLHYEHGPAIIWKDGSKEWYVNGKRHRDDGPAIEMITGEKHWYKNDLRHRENGPASTYPNGNGERWYINGKLHREDGPAVYLKNGTIKEYWINDKQVDKEIFNLAENINEKNKNITKKNRPKQKI